MGNHLAVRRYSFEKRSRENTKITHADDGFYHPDLVGYHAQANQLISAMTSLSKRLKVSAQNAYKDFLDHPLHKTFSQPVLDIDRAVIFRYVADLSAPGFTEIMLTKGADIMDTEQERQLLLAARDQWLKKLDQFGQEYRQLVGAVGERDAKQTPPDTKWLELLAFIKKIIVEKNGLMLLVVIYSAYKNFNLLLNKCHPTFLDAFPSHQEFKSEEGIKTFEALIDANPKAQTLDDKEFEELVKVLVKQIEMDIEYSAYITTGQL